MGWHWTTLEGVLMVKPRTAGTTAARAATRATSFIFVCVVESACDDSLLWVLVGCKNGGVTAKEKDVEKEEEVEEKKRTWSRRDIFGV